MKSLSIALAGLALAAAPASAGTVVVAGDSTIASRAVQGIAGNIRFARNLLGGGDRVAIYRYSVITTFPAPPLGEQLAGVFNGFAGVTATNFDAGIDAATLADTDLLVLLGREFAFSAAETDLIGRFVRGGGTLLLAGESQNIGAGANAVANPLLAGIGSTLRLSNAAIDPGDRFAVRGEGEVATDLLTAGIDSFGYGFTSLVTGGTSLFLTDTDQSFVAYEALAVPEPASWAMMIGGFGVAGAAMRRRRTALRFG